MPSSDEPEAPLVLVADTDSSVAGALAGTLAAAGFRVDEVLDGPALLEFCAATPPDLVLLDVRFSIEGGVAACRSIRELPGGRAPAIVMLHGADDDDWIQPACEAGALEFLAKPVHEALLRHRVARALAWASEQAADSPAAQSGQRASGKRIHGEPLVDATEFLELASKSIPAARADGKHVAILAIDLDFECRDGSARSDLHPARIEDYVSSEVPGRIRRAVLQFEEMELPGPACGEILVGRIAPTRFAVLLPDLDRVQDAAKLGTRILEVLEPAVVIDGRDTRPSVSIGIASFPTDGDGARDLIDMAETAAYCARQEGRGNLQFYTASMSRWAFERLTLENSLRQALEREEFLVYYQPRLELPSRRVVGFEALIRWKHPQLGMVSPAQFIPLAEETGLIVPIGKWVLRTACMQARLWQKRGFQPIRMSVNLSAVQFHQPSIVDDVNGILAEVGYDPSWLELELTESMLMNDVDSTIDRLKSLKRSGIQLSIDDFGTGYSSLSYLKRFPIDSLKIDQSFVRDVTSSPDDAAIATSIILMGHSLKLNVVAEGVEDESQLAFLQVLKCNEVQGYLFSPPVPPEQAERFLTVLTEPDSSPADVALAATPHRRGGEE